MAHVGEQFAVIERQLDGAPSEEEGQASLEAYVVLRHAREAQGNLIAKFQLKDTWERAPLALEPKRDEIEVNQEARILDYGMMEAAGEFWQVEDVVSESSAGSIRNVYAVEGWFDRLVYSHMQVANTEIEIKLIKQGNDAEPSIEWGQVPGIVAPSISEDARATLKALLSGEIKLSEMQPLHEGAQVGDTWTARVGSGDDASYITWRVVAQLGHGMFRVEVDRGDGLVIAYNAGGFHFDEGAPVLWAGIAGEAPTEIKPDRMGESIHSVLNPGYDYDEMNSAAELDFIEPFELAGRTWEQCDGWTIGGTSIVLDGEAWFDGVLRVHRSDEPIYELAALGTYPCSHTRLMWDAPHADPVIPSKGGKSKR